MTDARPPSRRPYPALDGVRGIAVLLVMVHNLTLLEHRESLVEKLYVFVTDAGWIGVQLFFVLSGFLITGILLDDRGRPRFYRNFYVRRLVRIFPLYYLALIARFLIVPRIIPDAEVPFEVALGFWLYVSNWTALSDGGINGFAHFWSLAVEEQFYLAWPLAVGKLGARGLVWVCAGLVAMSAIARAIVYARGVDPQWLYLSTVTRADALAFGALVAIALRDPRARVWLQRAQLPIAAIAGLGLAGVMAFAHGLSRFNPLVETVGYSLLAILFAIGIAYIALDDTRARPRWLCNVVLRTLGKYSYAAYVVHAPLKVAMLYYAKPWLEAQGVHTSLAVDAATVGALIAGSFVLARLSYAVLEGPLLALKERWAPRA